MLRYYKLTTVDDKHHTHRFTEGLNVDQQKFGFRYFNLEDLGKYLYYNGKTMANVWLVDIPEDAITIKTPFGLRSNKLILSNKQSLEDFFKQDIDLSEEILSQGMMECGYNLKYILPSLITYKLCQLAVNQNWSALKFVPEQFIDENLCLTAARQNYASLIIIPDIFLNDDIIITAIGNKHWLALSLIPKNKRSDKVVKVASSKKKYDPAVIDLQSHYY